MRLKYLVTAILLFISLFASAQAGMMLASPAAAPGATYLLDTYTGAAAAYAMNKLKSDATNCVTILRASDNDTLVVGFSGGDFDSSTATTFVSSGHGYVITWWDQSGNGYHARQTDTSLAPLIILNGAIISENSKPTISFDGINDYLNHVFTGTLTQPGTIFSVSKEKDLNPSYILMSNNFSTSWRVYRGSSSIRINSGTLLSASNSTTSQILRFSLFNGASSIVGLNGANLTTGNAGTNSYIGDFRIGADRTTDYNDGNIQLIILYPSDQSSNRTGIESNINSYYSIY